MKLNVTPGEWVIEDKAPNGMVPKTSGIAIVQNEYDNYDVACVWKDAGGNPEHNATLIADAGTTYNKCGLTPSELLQQNEELRGFLSTLETNLMFRVNHPAMSRLANKLLTKHPKP